MSREVIGSAYIRVRALTTEFDKDVKKSLDAFERETARRGRVAGRNFSDAFAEGFGRTFCANLGRIMSDCLEERLGDGRAGGELFADAFGDGYESRIGDRLKRANVDAGAGLLDGVAESVDRAVDAVDSGASDMSDSVRRGNADIDRDTDRTWTSVGRRINNSLDTNMFSRMWSRLTRGAQAASDKLTSFFAVSQLVGAALYGLIGGLVNLVDSLFALSSAALQAAPALAGVLNLFSALGQFVATIGIGFIGVGKAIQAGTQAADAATKTNTRLQSALRGVETAQNGVKSATRSLENAWDAAKDAADAVADAQIDLARAQRDLDAANVDLERSQSALNDAFKEGQEQLQQLAFDAEDAKLAQEQAAIDLAKAQDDLAEAQRTTPADSRERQEAELAVARAELALRRATDRAGDLARENADAQAAGVEGTDAVVNARNDIASAENAVVAAQERLLDAQQRVADAQERQARATRNVQRAQEDLATAMKKLAEAQANVTQVQKEGTAEQQKYNDALKDLGPNARAFVEQLVGMKDRWKELRQAAGEGFFDDLRVALDKFANGPAWGVVKDGLSQTSDAVGRVIKRFSDMLFSGENLGILKRIFSSNTKVIDSFGGAATNLGQALLYIMDAARPLVEEFSRWIEKLTMGWRASLSLDHASGRLSEKLQRAGVVAKKLGALFGALFRGIRNIGRAAAPAGQTLLDWLTKSVKKWEEWTASAEGQNFLKKFFRDAIPATQSILTGLKDIIFEVLKLGDNKGLKNFGDFLTTASTWIDPIAQTVDRVGPALQGLAENVGGILVALSESPAFDVFVETLSTVTGWIKDILSTDAAQWFLVTAGGVWGFTRALRVLRRVGSFLIKGTLISGLETLRKISSGTWFRGDGGSAAAAGTRTASAGAQAALATGTTYQGVGAALGAKLSAGLAGTAGEAEAAGRTVGSAGAAGAAATPTSPRPTPGAGTAGAIADSDAEVVAAVRSAATEIVLAIDRCCATLSRGLGIATAADAADGTPVPVPGGGGGRPRPPVPAPGRAAASAAEAAAAGAVTILPQVGTEAAGAGKKVGLLGNALSFIRGLNFAKVLNGLKLGFKAIGGPIGAIILGVTLLIPAFQKFWDENEGFREAVKGIWDTVSAFVSEIMKGFEEMAQWLSEELGPLLKDVGEFLAPVFDAIKAGALWLKDHAGPIVSAFFGIAKVQMSIVITAMKIGFTVIKAVIVAVIAAISGIFQAVKWVWDKVWALIEGAVGFINSMITVLSTTISGIIGFIQGAFSAAWTAIQAVWAPVKAFFSAIFQGIQAAAASFIGIVRGIFEKAWQFVQAVWGIAVSWFKLLWDAITAPFRIAIDLVQGKFQEAWGVVTGLWSGLTEFFGTVWEGVTKGVEVVKETLLAPFKWVYEQVQTLWNGFGEWFGGILEAIPETVRGIWDGLKGWINEWIIDKANGAIEILNLLNPAEDIPPIPHLAEGGTVRARPGGTPVIVGEGGQSEVVQPLDAQGFTRGDRAMLNALGTLQVISMKGFQALIALSRAPDTAARAATNSQAAVTAAIVEMQKATLKGVAELYRQTTISTHELSVIGNLVAKSAAETLSHRRAFSGLGLMMKSVLTMSSDHRRMTVLNVQQTRLVMEGILKLGTAASLQQAEMTKALELLVKIASRPQPPTVGNLYVTSAPGEPAAQSVPAALRASTYRRTGSW